MVGVLPPAGPVRVAVLDQIVSRPDEHSPWSAQGLTAARRSLVATLVAAGPHGVPALELTSAEQPESAAAQSALRMAVTRLRPHVPPGSIPDASNGRYRLALPTEAVDVWLLLDLAGGAALGHLDEPTLRHLVRATEPYSGAGASSVLDDSTYVIDAARRRLVVRLSRERPEVLDGSMRADVSAHLDGEPLNEELLRAAVRCLLDAGDRRGAITVLSRASHGLVDAGLTLPDDLAEVERDLLAGVAPTSTSTAPPLVVAPRQHDIPERLRDAVRTPFIGDRGHIDAAVDRLESAHAGVTAVVVRGLAGAGKSRLLAEIADSMHLRGWAVVDAVATPPPATSALAPLVASLPGLHDTVQGIWPMSLDAESRRAALWAATRTALADAAHGRPILLLVDDAQWCDSQTSDFLAQLLTSGSESTVIGLIVCGRSDSASTDGWSTLAAAAARAGATDTAPAPLDAAAMAEFVEQRRPELTLRERHDLVDELTSRSGGLPGVAAVLLAGYDPVRRRLPTAHQLTRDSSAAFLPDGDLSTAARTIGAVAAVVGGDVGLEELMAIAELSADDVLDGIEELIERDLMTERSPVLFATTHALADAALLAGVSRRQVAQWHAAAAQVRAGDVHRAARHLAGAVPFVPISDAVDAQLLAADALLDEGLAPEAAAAFDSAETLSGAPLQPGAVIGQSRALDLTGAHAIADDVRARAIGDALAQSDHATALRLAISGLPEAEAVEGSDVTITHLLRIDPTALGRRDRWRHASALARQSALQGRLDESTRWADAAQQLAVSHDEKVSSALATRSVRSAVTDPSERLTVLDTVADDVDAASPELRAEYLLLRSIDLFESADTAAALECHDRLCAVNPLPALRRWHADLFAAMASTDAGDAATASRLRSEALQFAADARFREGESAYLIAEFVDLWLSGDAALLLPMFDAGAIDPDRAPATRAAIAVVLDAAGRGDEALAHAEEAVEAVVAAPVFQGIPALAFAARILARSSRHDLIGSAVDLLSARGPSMLVLGAGATSLGPVDRYLAHLATSPDDRLRHLTRAAEVAARAASPRWTAVVRAELDAL